MKIKIPDQIAGRDDIVFVANVSGGKDSTALALALREADVPYRRVFADTGWEAPETYEYLDVLRSIIGPIDVVGLPGGMAQKVREHAGFPSVMRRWCTGELKLKPLRAYHDAIEKGGHETVCTVGLRAQEGGRRASLPEIEDDSEWGGWMWRPLIKWSVEEVIAIHHRHGVPLNPLYHKGYDRVGCFPCIMAVSKGDLRLLAKHGQGRIEQIRELEKEATAERKRRNAEDPGRYTTDDATFFLAPSKGKMGTMKIDNIIAWAKTDRGGKQLPMFDPAPDGGCFRWGVCDAPTKGQE